MALEAKGAEDAMRRMMMRQTETTLLVVLVQLEQLRDNSAELHAYDGLCLAVDLLEKVVSKFQANIPDPQRKPTPEEIWAASRAGE